MQPKQKKNKLCAVHEKIPVNNQMCQKCFLKFLSWSFCFIEEYYTVSRPGEMNNNLIKT